MRYLSQRYSMPYQELKGLLTDIGTEELGHLEMVGALVHQLTREMSPEEIKKAGQTRANRIKERRQAERYARVHAQKKR